MTLPLSFIGLISGIVLSELVNIKCIYILACILCVVTVIISVVIKKIFHPMLCCAIMMIVGFTITNNALDINNNVLSKYDGKEVKVTGQIIDLPTQNNKLYKYTVDVKQLSFEDEIISVDEDIIITSETEFEFGEVIHAEGKLKRFPENMNENGFNSKLYYKSKGISFKLFSENISKANIHIKNCSLNFCSNVVRAKIINEISKHYVGDKAAVLVAIITGNKKTFSQDLRNILTKTGVSRCLYPSYLHIFMILSLFSLIRYYVPKKYRITSMCALILLYGAINSSNPIFIKASLYTAMIYLFKHFFGYAYRRDLLYIIMIALFLANPLLIYNGGLVISLAASFIIIAFMKYTTKRLKKKIQLLSLRNIVAVNILCSIGLLPLSAYYFNGISVYQLFVTLIFTPLTVVTLICTPFMLIFWKLFSFAPIIDSIVNTILNIYIKVPYLIDKLPFSYVTLPTPTLPIIATFYLFVYALFLYTRKRKFQYSLGIATVLTVVIVIGECISSFTAELTFINVGQADAALISVPYRSNIIIDGGGSADYSDYSIGEEIFIPYLQSKGKTHIDAAFISHYHKDHVEGILALIENLSVKKVYMPDFLPDNEWRIKIENAAISNKTEINYITKDETIKFDGGIIINAIIPTETALFTEDENNTTVVYKAEYGKTSCLFTGDITSTAEIALAHERYDLSSDILKVSHHGSAKSSSQYFIDEVNPQYAVICVGEDNPYKFPRQEVLERLKNTKIYRTDLNGDITFKINRNGIKRIKTLR